MKSFLQRLYQDRHKNVEVILLDDSKPGQDNSYTIKPNNLFISFVFISLAFSLVVALVFMLTPLGSLLYSTDEAKIRSEIQDISTRIIALQDSLEVRDQQLLDIKEVIRLNKDTTLTLDEKLQRVNSGSDNQQLGRVQTQFADLNIFEQFETENFLAANILKDVPDFPARSPASGTNTRGYEPMQGHFGLDIATKEGEVFMSVADGTVISGNWTLDFGYVISIQHNDGIISIYKHCSKLYKIKGEKVLKGDILGLIGDTGLSSSGPHLHFEIWKNGISQNPISYLIF